jgi:hypothetical protein
MWCCPDSQDVGLEAAIIKRKRNSSLVKRHRAENLTGLKHFTEAADFRIVNKVHNPGSMFKVLRFKVKKTGGFSITLNIEHRTLNLGLRVLLTIREW